MLRKIYAENYVKVENFSCFRSKSKKTLKKHILVSFFFDPDFRDIFTNISKRVNI